ncbi:hypothetical protein GXN76_00625 [Kroppenstedtia pulmonis]|uniref:Yip1 domain-containing protein n=1 Tax=Kroppenstedtia pulmonis TaxID=1380685 RepID=A0A7D3XNM4_9BACL|nr:YIP1 family protein [Kroppenstedtia pulmonis]QKG83107.1 hypothetical protein GXN76_00625 [Kroppenstedtia pulmonis]
MNSLNPFRTIWIHTRETVHELIEHNRPVMMYLLILLFGLNISLERASITNLADSTSLLAIPIIVLLLTPIMGFAVWFFGGLLVYWTGSWLGGIGTFKEMRIAVAWSTIPFALKTIIWVLQVILFGREMFAEITPRIDSSPLLTILLGLITLIDLIITAWFYVILSKSIGEAHNISSIKGFLSIVLGIALVLGCLLFLILVFSLIR